MSSPLAIVLAAGKGTRMKSELPKVLVPVAGRPMIEFVLDALTAAGVRDIVVVIGYRGDLVRQMLAGRSGIRFAEQREQLGTGHAVMAAGEYLAAHDGPVMVVMGDCPLMQSSSLAALLTDFDRTKPACVLGTIDAANPTGLGRIIRDSAGRFTGIVEERDATPEQRRITEVNMSYYVFDCRELLHALEHVDRRNAQGEYYLTDCPGILAREGKSVEALCVLQPIEALSINNADELAAVERELTR
jgi:bifunctional UDP-N-acetylglucosamine pyrophosphorylase/glucosamine-1-phosphate N-acetyltransferase/UDP-N-acetylglucosamine pyrophosphorylase